MLEIATESYKNTKNWFARAENGDFIKDRSPQKRSLGVVVAIDYDCNMMRVKFPKIGKFLWIPWKNNGHYYVV
jgi:hypothetical protein